MILICLDALPNYRIHRKFTGAVNLSYYHIFLVFMTLLFKITLIKSYNNDDLLPDCINMEEKCGRWDIFHPSFISCYDVWGEHGMIFCSFANTVGMTDFMTELYCGRSYMWPIISCCTEIQSGRVGWLFYLCQKWLSDSEIRIVVIFSNW